MTLEGQKPPHEDFEFGALPFLDSPKPSDNQEKYFEF